MGFISLYDYSNSDVGAGKTGIFENCESIVVVPNFFLSFGLPVLRRTVLHYG